MVFEETDNPFVMANVFTIELRRSLLNLIKNAIFATDQDGVIKISLTQNNDNVVITIIDNGSGISPETVYKLNKGEAITNSRTGKGIGFRYAKHIIEKMNGKIEMQTAINKGTTQIITLPIATQKPNWFTNEINLSKYKKIVILDDDDGIQSIYKDLFKSYNKQLIQLNNTKNFEEFMQNNKDSDNALFLIDYAIDNILPSGLDLIKKYNLEQDAILITNMYLEDFVKDRSMEYNVKLLPKTLLPFCKLT